MTWTGGERMMAALKELQRKLGRQDKLRVGFLEDATYPDGTPVALVAAANDFGTKTSPPRPFFRDMIAANKGHWARDLAGAMRLTNNDVNASLHLMGEQIEGELKQSITDFEGVPLADSTIARKGFDKQLIDTSHMWNSVDYEVKK